MAADRSPSRRSILKRALALATVPAWLPLQPSVAATVHPANWRRVRPGEPGWPTAAQWGALRAAVGGRLAVPGAAFDPATDVRNPFALSDDPGHTQSAGWFDAWRSTPSAYVVAVTRTSDVVAAVDFARRHRLRLVVRGGGHSYQGTSCAPDSLLVWMRPMHDVTLHDAFVAAGSRDAPQPAVSVGAGALWIDAYDAVTTRGGRYVQGGGCTTVGVAGLVQSGGFGSFSKGFGMAAAGLLEAEVVTADGQVRVVSAERDADLFWALKGGGGGAFGVVTRLTLRTRELPAFFGGAFLRVAATSSDAYRRLIARFMRFYRDRLLDPHWGEQVVFDRQNVLSVKMVFQGLTQDEAVATWRPFIDAVRAAPADYELDEPRIAAFPARHFWDARALKTVPGIVVADDRPGAPEKNFYWAGDGEQPGQMIHAYRSAWLGADALTSGDADPLVEGLFAASRQWTVGLHFNKGLAGASREDRDAARGTAMNPGVIDAFALAIISAGSRDAYRHEPDREKASREAVRVGAAMDALLARVPSLGTYVSESDYFDADWQRGCWGVHYARLAAIKRHYDPDGLFFAHHGAGTEGWSDDGFVRRA